MGAFALRPWAAACHTNTPSLGQALRLAFADSQRFVADPDIAPAPVEELLSSRYADERSRTFDEHAVWWTASLPRLGPN